jgi:hypothetical protein
MSEAAPTEVKGELVAIEPQERVAIHADPDDVAAAIERYKKIQAVFDRMMPECQVTIQGKVFRKKSYWRGIAQQGHISVSVVKEERVEYEERDWGWLVTCRASVSDCSADGDGSCFVSEKRGAMATVHNVRAHAHTRAYNRAVSNLVGFGEVSAEEMIQNTPRHPPWQSASRTISEKQQKRIFAICKSTADRLQIPQDTVRAKLREHIENLGLDSTSDLTEEPYEILCKKMEDLSLNDLVQPSDDGEAL